MAQLEDSGLQCAHGVEYVVVAAVYAIQTETEPAGVKLAFGEVLYSGTVAYMAQNLVVKSLLKFGACLVKEFKLSG